MAPFVQLLLIASSLVLFAGPSNAQTIAVAVNGQTVRFDGTQPQEVNGRVMVPLRGVLEQIGAQVRWDPESRTATAVRENRVIRLKVDSATAEVDGRPVTLDVPAMLITGRVMVPLRFMAESLGGAVTWDSEQRMVRVATVSETEQAVDRPVPRSYARIRTAPAAQRVPRATTEPVTTYLGFIRENSVIPVTLDTALDSRSSKAGDSVSATVETGAHDAKLPRGAYFRGMVRFVSPMRDSQSGAISVEFTDLVFPDGSRVTVHASPFPLESRNVQNGLGGYLVARPESSLGSLMFVGSGITLARADALPNGRVRMFVEPTLSRTPPDPADVSLRPGARFGVRLARQMTFDPTGTVLADDR